MSSSGGQSQLRETEVVDQAAALDAGFLERQRQRLLALREELRNTTEAVETEESTLNSESTLQANEYEDDAQKLDSLEREGNLARRDLERLAGVERALGKIDAGTYGFSDVSGQRIPDDRLEAMPEAVSTVAEQQALEPARERG
jgi:DnaK suppressor protein